MNSFDGGREKEEEKKSGMWCRATACKRSRGAAGQKDQTKKKALIVKWYDEGRKRRGES